MASFDPNKLIDLSTFGIHVNNPRHKCCRCGGSTRGWGEGYRADSLCRNCAYVTVNGREHPRQEAQFYRPSTVWALDPQTKKTSVVAFWEGVRLPDEFVARYAVVKIDGVYYEVRYNGGLWRGQTCVREYALELSERRITEIYAEQQRMGHSGVRPDALLDGGTAPTEFQHSKRTFDQPVVVVTRKMGYSRKPVDQIPPLQRTGMLHIAYATKLEIQDSGTGNDYPHGTHFSWDGCDVWLEVLPKGISQAEQQKRAQQPVLISSVMARGLRPLLVPNTPMIGSAEAGTMGYSTGTSDHMTLVQPERLGRYLQGVLPYIGVDPHDVAAVLQYVTTLLQQGIQERASRERR
jgi:hypothetical protein